jgi:hypothetical protein
MTEEQHIEVILKAHNEYIWGGISPDEEAELPKIQDINASPVQSLQPRLFQKYRTFYNPKKVLFDR